MSPMTSAPQHAGTPCQSAKYTRHSMEARYKSPAASKSRRSRSIRMGPGMIQKPVEKVLPWQATSTISAGPSFACSGEVIKEKGPSASEQRFSSPLIARQEPGRFAPSVQYLSVQTPLLSTQKSRRCLPRQQQAIRRLAACLPTCTRIRSLARQ